MYQAYKLFRSLNIRFRNLFTLSTDPIEVNFCLMSRASFEESYREFFGLYTDRIRSLHVSNRLIINSIISFIPNPSLFTRLETLYLNNMNIKDSHELFDYLSLLPQLSTLIISSINKCYDKNLIYNSIFRLSSLKYCKISINDTDDTPHGLLMTESDILSPIEHLVIDSCIYLQELARLLSHVPHLRRLSIKCVISTFSFYRETLRLTLHDLTHVSLKLKYINFDEFEPFFKLFFTNLRVLHLSTHMDRQFANAQRWEHLIITHMPNLRIFDLQHTILLSGPVQCRQLMEPFTGLFWIERKWFFTHTHYCSEYPNEALFYSIQPYRRKEYTLTGVESQCSSSENRFDSVRHIHIDHELAIANHSINIPNATELTFGKDLDISHDFIAKISTNIIPLFGITKITITDYICFTNVAKMLLFTPNCKYLTLPCLSFNEQASFSNESFDNVQEFACKNIIQCVNIQSCTLDDVQLLLKFFRRLEYLTISVTQEELQSILKCLVTGNENNRYLHSVCIRSTSDIWDEKLINIIKEVRQEDEVSINMISYCNSYLWW
ncbi:unnamed protein product [Adineta ricciae]|uniref:Uncharacterized protein n=2 Tax=Adineta ricciae TaxID=249248 RepID=A0A815MDG0_ADIRI|nr:unnamed protein product [Adineta ricciae]